MSELGRVREVVCAYTSVLKSSWNAMAHGDAREGKWRGNWRMEWVANTLHTTSEHGVSSITTADTHTSAASSRLNWRPRRFKWTRPFRRKTKSGFCACAITFETQSPAIGEVETDTPTARMRVECLQVTPGLLEDLCCIPFVAAVSVTVGLWYMVAAITWLRKEPILFVTSAEVCHLKSRGLRGITRHIHTNLMYVWPCIIYENDKRYQHDATIVIYYHKYFYMFRASICPSSGVQVVCYKLTQCTRLHTGSLGPQLQHLMLNTTCSNIQPLLLKMGI